MSGKGGNHKNVSVTRDKQRSTENILHTSTPLPSCVTGRESEVYDVHVFRTH